MHIFTILTDFLSELNYKMKTIIRVGYIIVF